MSLPSIEPERDVPSRAPIPEDIRSPRPAPRRPVSTLRSIAIALSAPCIFYGVLGVGSTFIVWALIQFDALRPDFYLGIFAAAGPVAFLIRAHGLEHGWRVPPLALAVALNLGCVACAILVAVLRSGQLEDPVLAAVLALLVVAPVLNSVVLLTDTPARR